MEYCSHCQAHVSDDVRASILGSFLVPVSEYVNLTTTWTVLTAAGRRGGAETHKVLCDLNYSQLDWVQDAISVSVNFAWDYIA